LTYQVFSYSSEFFDYLEIELGYSPASQRGVADDMRLFFFFLQLEYPEIGAITEIKEEHIRSFLAFLKDVRYNQPATRNRKLATLRIYFSFLKSEGLLGRQKNPVRNLRFAKKPKKLPVYLTREEAEKMLKAASIDTSFPFRDQAIMYLFLQTGCRLQELVQLSREDVDLKERLVRYWGKGESERQVPLTERTVRVLGNHLECRPPWQQSPYLFLNFYGVPLGKRGVQLLFHRIRKKAGVDRPGLTVHKLRHTCLTLLLKEGVGIAVLQELAGHRDIGSTEIYTHVAQEELRRAMKKHPLG